MRRRGFKHTITTKKQLQQTLFGYRKRHFEEKMYILEYVSQQNFDVKYVCIILYALIYTTNTNIIISFSGIISAFKSKVVQ